MLKRQARSDCRCVARATMLQHTAANDLEDRSAELLRPGRDGAHDQLRVCAHGILGDLNSGDALLRQTVLRVRPQAFGKPSPLRILLNEPDAALAEYPREGSPVHRVVLRAATVARGVQ